MNADRRARIAALQDKLIGMQTEIETLRDEEQEAFDNMPESLQQSDKGEKAQAAIEALEEAINSVDEVHSTLDTVKE